MTAAPQSCQPDMVQQLRANRADGHHGGCQNCYGSLMDDAADRIEELTKAIDRKAIAKIIDPDAWRRWSNERGGIGLACWPTERHREEAFTRADLIISDSLAKADAILSLWGVAMPLEQRGGK